MTGKQKTSKHEFWQLMLDLTQAHEIAFSVYRTALAKFGVNKDVTKKAKRVVDVLLKARLALENESAAVLGEANVVMVAPLVSLLTREPAKDVV